MRIMPNFVASKVILFNDYSIIMFQNENKID
jgi:hypothetical protein